MSSLRQVVDSQWDALAGDNALASHGWLLAAEEENVDEIEPRYVLVHHGSQLVAAAACYLCRPGNTTFDPDRLMLRRLRPVAAQFRLSLLPAVICCPYRCYGKHLLIHDRLQGHQREQIIGRLLDAVEGLAGAEALPLWFPQVTDSEADTIRHLRRRNYHRTRHPPVVYLDIVWDSFDGYLAHLRSFSANMPRIVRREINRNRKAGVVIEEIPDPRLHQARLYDLADRHYFRLNKRRVPYTPEFLPKLKENLGDGLVLYGAFRNGTLLGFSTLLRRGPVAYMPFLGLDRERTRRDFTYFNICFYRPIADAIERGIKRVYFGKMLYRMKARRGCQTLRFHTLYRSPSLVRHIALQPFFAFHASWMERKLAVLEDVEALRRLPHA